MADFVPTPYAPDPGPQRRAHLALAHLYGRVAACGKLTYSGTDAHTDGLIPGFYVIYAQGGDLCFTDSLSAAVADGTCPVIPGGTTVGTWLGVSGTTFNLHAIQVSTGGTLWWSRMTTAGQ